MQITKVFCDDEALINKKLPKELLLRIFSYLDVVSLCRCAQVSKSWNVLALDGSNWQRIDLFEFQKDVEVFIAININYNINLFASFFYKHLAIYRVNAISTMFYNVRILKVFAIRKNYSCKSKYCKFCNVFTIMRLLKNYCY